jgi:hypothetical protein
MSSRVVGAGLALIAAALLAVSIATPAVLPAALSLFAGHPTVNDHTRETQDVYIGLYDAQLCNSGGDGTCKSGNADEDLGFRIVGFAELGAIGLGTVSLVALGLLTLRRDDRRKRAARLVRFASALALAGVAAMFVLSPFKSASIPIGVGMIAHGVGLIGGLIASSIAVRPPPPIKLRVAHASQPVPTIPAPAHAPAFDVQALFGDDPLRAPARTAEPQLRPLYDAKPMHGGTGGLLPIEPPAAAAWSPPPSTRASVEIDGPTAIAPPLPFGAERAKPKTLPPPSPAPRSKPMTVPPPHPSAPAGRTQVSFVPPMPALAVPELETAMAAIPVAIEPIAAPPPPGPPPPPLGPPGPPAPPATAQRMSDGRPEAAAVSAGTEPTLFPHLETPLAEPPPPLAPRIEPPPPPIVPAVPPRAQRATQSPPPPRSQRETQSPRPAALRASVPMPVRPVSPTRPPPLAIPPRPTVSITVPPPPRIPALPIPAIPAIPPGRAETDAEDRPDRFEPALDDATGSRIPIEVSEHGSQTNVSDVLVGDPDTGLSVRAPDTSPTGEPIHASADGHAAGATLNGVAMPPPAPPTPVFPVAIAAPTPPPVVRERPTPRLPISTAPDSLPPPKDVKHPAAGPSPACPQCEAPMAWVEEHLRFYCKSCRMYF